VLAIRKIQLLRDFEHIDLEFLFVMSRIMQLHGFTNNKEHSFDYLQSQNIVLQCNKDAKEFTFESEVREISR
jgi:hypothetical protein